MKRRPRIFSLTRLILIMWVSLSGIEKKLGRIGRKLDLLEARIADLPDITLVDHVNEKKDEQ